MKPEGEEKAKQIVVSPRKLLSGDTYWNLLEKCKHKAAIQKVEQIKEAERLCQLNSPTSQRKGRLLLKAAETIDKDLIKEFEHNVCDHLTTQAEYYCYGSKPCPKRRHSEWDATLLHQLCRTEENKQLQRYNEI